LIPEALLEALDFISPNETELMRLMNSDISEINPEEIKKKFLIQYKNLTFILKLGDKGSRVIN